ncbi:serine--tRNA ligase, mitochondrial-like, partial [Lytechinus variegatus]|uniref:serine--tRNA ligase, mitochondrial-like n=1 Tax=Lytechinus variegatus TaxID=7654 RepID=UPI001BB1160E
IPLSCDFQTKFYKFSAISHFSILKMFVKLRYYDIARQINTFVWRSCSNCKIQSCTTPIKNSAAFERNGERLSRLEIRRHLGTVSHVGKRFSSTSLYTPSSEGEHVPFVLKPELDFNTIMLEEEKFKKSIEAREIKGINISEMISIWNEVCNLEEQKNEMERKRKALNTRAKQLSKQKGEAGTKEKIQLEGRKIREEVKRVNSTLNDLMNRLYPLALALPNHLHNAVPIGEENIEKESFGGKLTSPASQEQHPCLSVHNPMVHPGYQYTEGDLVLKEYDLISSVSSHLTSNGFTRFSMPDMYKPITMEALGLNPENSNESYVVQTSENIMHLAGTSPMGFLAYYMMSVLEASDLPQRSFAVGRHYNASKESSNFEGLHNQFQDSRGEIFGVSEGTEDASNALLFQYLDMLIDLILTFDIPFRTVEVSSRNLLPCMHRMMSVEVWLPSEENYVEVANVCNCTDFISRRLKIRYPINPRESAVQSRKRSFVHTIHGTALKPSVLLSALLDHGALDVKEARS